jgi:hypothetical protein
VTATKGPASYWNPGEFDTLFHIVK